MVDSSSWTIPDSESGGCQLGILEEIFLEAKIKMATVDYVLRNIFASKTHYLVSTPMLFQTLSASSAAGLAATVLVCSLRQFDPALQLQNIEHDI